MENINKKPLFLIAFFTFIIALFFTVEQMDYFPNHAQNRVERQVKSAKRGLAGISGDLYHQIACPAKKYAKFTKRLVFCPVKKGAKFAVRHGMRFVRDMSDKLPF